MWTLLLACSDQWTGTLQSSTGTPLAAIPIEAGTHRAETASDGGFAVPPVPSVTFTHGGVRYTAHERRTDPFRLPPLRKALVHCDPGDPCEVVLAWPEVDGLAVEARHGCKANESFPLDAPVGVPTATCGARTLYVDERPDALHLLPEGRRVRIHVVSADGSPLPTDCETWLDTVPARRDGADWVGRIGETGGWAGGRCGGRGLAGVRVDGPEVTLTWSAAGPTLRLGDRAPWATDLVLVDPSGWTVLLHPVDGAFLLPTVPPGTYLVDVRGPDPIQADTVLLPDAPADGLRLTPGGDRILLGKWTVVTPGQDPPVVE